MTKRQTLEFFAVTLLGALVRLARLGFPAQTMFDEIYYPDFAQRYLHHLPVTDVHPPLGKLIIALGIILFGNNPVGWRAMPALAGVLLVPALYLLARNLFGSHRAGMVAALCAALDGILIVYSRAGLLESFLLLFITLMLLFGFMALRSKGNPATARPFIVLTGVSFGAAVAVKWIALGIVPALGIIAYRLFQVRNLRRIVPVALLITPIIVYLISFSFEASWRGRFWQEFARWHRYAYHYHTTLKATRDYGAPFYRWPTSSRPIIFYRHDQADIAQTVVAMGNPAIWWGSAALVGYSLIRLLRRRLPKLLTLPLVGFAASWLPWAFVQREVYIYHYLTALVFAILILAFWLDQMLADKKLRPFALGYGVLVIAAFIFLYPVWSALPTAKSIQLERDRFVQWLK